VVGQDDWVHFQWTGNDNTNNNGNNNGEGTNSEDRHNIVQIANLGLNVPLPASEASMFDVQAEWNPHPKNLPGNFDGPRDQQELVRQFALVKQTDCLEAGAISGDQQRQNCEKLNAAAATIDLGMLKFKPGVYKYMSSRNNNFSNRAQKGKITVVNSLSVPPRPPTKLTARSVENAPEQVRVEWGPHGADDYVTTSGAVVPGRSEELWDSMDYVLQVSSNAGEDWWSVERCADSVSAKPECDASGTRCHCAVEALDAAATYSFRVLAGGAGGWSEPSEMVSQTMPPGGSSLNAGAIAATVMAIIAALALFCAAVFFYQRRQPPPPPPPVFKPMHDQQAMLRSPY